MTRRRVKPDELELWQTVARSADPLHKRANPAPRSDPTFGPTTGPKPRDPLPNFDIGQKAPPKTQTRLPMTTAERLQKAPVQMDAKAFQRLKRGKLKPEARLDLHGMTLAQAHPALNRFILMSQGQGMRLVLVITGKGDRGDPYDPAPRRRGVLKAQVPQWLRMAPLAQAILQVTEAHIRHGGGGAFYVYLRKL